ncbi:MAG: LacI family DNA-binding transcriptional regulator [Lachnospiraceae bacterium]|nr:LacI family DNA-binding transcriptional regulator [Lachnospiraceae bacterium]
MNIYDIAKLSGVSIATVSRVVNNSPLVSEKTKARVRKVMEENNYIPNVFARGMSLGSMNTIGIVCPDIADSYMARAVAYLEKNLRDFGYDCILQCSGRDPAHAKSVVSNILNKKIDALFLIGSFYTFEWISEENADYIREAAVKIPVFMVNAFVRGTNIFCALCDDRSAAEQAVNLLIREGRKNILFLYNSDSTSTHEKRQGYVDALTEAGIVYEDKYCFRARQGIEEVKRDLLASISTEVDGIFATNDRLAAGALKYARETGIIVPDELSIIGYDNSELAISCDPEITSVDSMCETLCRINIDSLLCLLRGTMPEAKTLAKGILVRRASTLL